MKRVLIALLKQETATFNPTVDLATSTVYTVTLTTGITDVAGNAFAGDTWTFTTGLGTDTTAPMIVSWTPVDTATGISVATPQVIQFDKPMDRASVQGAFSLTPNPANPSAFFWNVAGDTVTVVFDTTSPVGVEADDLLAENTSYTAQVTTAAADLAGNTLAALASVTWTTQTDVTAPLIASTTPDVTQTQPAPTSLVITFNENMNQTFATVEMEDDLGSDQRSRTLGGPGFGGLTVVWNNATDLQLDFTSALLTNTAYAVAINVSDLAGNLLEEDEFFLVTAGADSLNPSVASTVPADGATGVDPDSPALLTFSRTMAPDIVDHINVSGNGSVQWKPDRMTDPPGVLVIPAQAWPPSSTITVTVAATATDASGNPLIAPFSFSFTTGAQSNSSWGLDADYNERKHLDDAVETNGFDEVFLFVDSGGDRVFVNEQTLASEDVTLREKDTEIPLKGFRLEALEGGELELKVPLPISLGLQTSTTYELSFNSSLRNSHGVGITPTAIEFTTSDGITTRPNLDEFLEVEAVVFGIPGVPGDRSVAIELLASDDDGDTLTVTAQSDTNPAFVVPVTESPPSSGFFEYFSLADELALTSTGLHPLSFQITDGTDSINIKRDIWNFGTSGFPRPTAPVGGIGTLIPGGVPTYTFSVPSATASAAHILVVAVVDALLDDAVLFSVLPPGATSFSHPSDTPLPPGDYAVYVGAARFSSGVLRGDFAGFTFGGSGGFPDFRVPVPGSATAGAATPVPAPAPSILPSAKSIYAANGLCVDLGLSSFLAILRAESEAHHLTAELENLAGNDRIDDRQLGIGFLVIADRDFDPAQELI